MTLNHKTEFDEMALRVFSRNAVCLNIGVAARGDCCEKQARYNA